VLALARRGDAGGMGSDQCIPSCSRASLGQQQHPATTSKADSIASIKAVQTLREFA
jgi:hypothetical protein